MPNVLFLRGGGLKKVVVVRKRAGKSSMLKGAVPLLMLEGKRTGKGDDRG